MENQKQWAAVPNRQEAKLSHETEKKEKRTALCVRSASNTSADSTRLTMATHNRRAR